MFSVRRCGLSNMRSLDKMRAVVLKNLQFRQYSKDKDCEPPKASKCGLVLAEYPCGPKKTKPYVSKPKVTQPPLVSMWKLENCEPELCVMDLRYDMKYYSISDKRKRKYQQTWNECPRIIVKPKKVCIQAKMVRPKIKRRKRSPVGASAAPPKTKSKCVYIANPCCKVGRRPPKCKSAFPSLGNCEKIKTPYPSFSECKKDPIIPLPPVECGCLNATALCDAWVVLRRRIARGQKPVKSCGEA